MKYICSFCDIDIAPTTGDGTRISHGVCKTCYNHIKASMGVDLQEFLSMLDHPVILVNRDVRILAANWKIHQMVDKELEKIREKLGGEVFECENSKLPGGCGKTIHCSGCTIRICVNETYQTGNPVKERPATLNQGIPGQSVPIELLISTYKSGELVLLMIDPAMAPNC